MRLSITLLYVVDRLLLPEALVSKLISFGNSWSMQRPLSPVPVREGAEPDEAEHVIGSLRLQVGH